MDEKKFAGFFFLENPKISLSLLYTLTKILSFCFRVKLWDFFLAYKLSKHDFDIRNEFYAQFYTKNKFWVTPSRVGITYCGKCSPAKREGLRKCSPVKREGLRPHLPGTLFICEKVITFSGFSIYTDVCKRESVIF